MISLAALIAGVFAALWLQSLRHLELIAFTMSKKQLKRKFTENE